MVWGVCCESILFGTTCSITLMPVTGCVLFPCRSVPVVSCYSTVGYTTDIAYSCLLTGSHISTGGGMFSFGAVDYDTAAINSTFFPVIIVIGRPVICRSMCPCWNRLPIADNLTTAETFCIAGITVSLCLVVCCSLIYQSCSANVIICILIAKEDMTVIVLYLTTYRAGIVVNSFVIAVAFGLQCFCLFRFSSIIVRYSIAVRLTAHGTNSLCSTGCSTACMLLRKCTIWNFCNFGFSVSFEELTTGITFHISIPTLVLTVGSLFSNRSFVCVRTFNSYHASVGKVTISCCNCDSSSTFFNTGYFTSCFVYSSNISVVRLKRNGFVCSFCRIYSIVWSFRLTCRKRQSFVNRNACNRYRCCFNCNNSRNNRESLCEVFKCLARAKL